MKKFLAIVCSILLIEVLTGCSKKNGKGDFTIEKGKLSIAMEAGYPPFEYYADDGVTPIGFDTLLGKEIAKRLGLEAVFIDTAWEGILAGLDTDRYDTIMSAMTITEERVKNYDFSQPYIGNGQAVIIRRDSVLSITDFKDLDGLKVGFQIETTSDFYCRKMMEELGIKINTFAYDNIMNAYDDLKLKRLDAVISDSLVAVSYLAPKDSDFKQVWMGKPDEYFGICIKKGNTVLLEKINKALDDMKADGTLANIYVETFGMDLSNSISSYSK